MGSKSQSFFFNTQVRIPFYPLILPISEKFIRFFGFYKILLFHLLELTHPINKVAGRYLIAKSLSDLAYAERNFSDHGNFYVLVIHIDALGGFPPQISKG